MLNKQYNKTSSALFALSFVAFTFFFSPYASALNADRDQVMQIEAGKVVMKEKEGVSQYSGNVKITQGSRIISGESITVHSKDNEVTKVVIKGEPAFFSQLNDQNEEIKGQSNLMVFYADKDLLVMKTNAILQQKDNIFKSDKITYDTAKDIISAGNSDGADDKRVTITINPKEETKTPQ